MTIVSIAISKKKGTRKICVEEINVIKDYGLEGDAHAGPWHRQVSFLAAESIEKARQGGLQVTFGDFAENIATEGIDWSTVPLGTHLRLGDSVLVEITQIGKECHRKCAIYYQAGDCIMPREGIFARVLEGGAIANGDPMRFVATETVG
jgi:MOSC domain-containing protein YiiM